MVGLTADDAPAKPDWAMLFGFGDMQEAQRKVGVAKSEEVEGDDERASQSLPEIGRGTSVHPRVAFRQKYRNQLRGRDTSNRTLNLLGAASPLNVTGKLRALRSDPQMRAAPGTPAALQYVRGAIEGGKAKERLPARPATR